jgi:hypothetical protein
MRTLSFVISCLFAFSIPAFAGEAQIDKARIDALVTDYFANETSKSKIATVKSLMKFDGTHNQDCEDQDDEEGNSTSCRDAACDRLGQFGCDDISEIRAVGEACRGNHNSACLELACDRLGRFGCDDLSEIRTVAQVCKGHYGRRCIKVACDRLGQFGCDDLSEIRVVGDACRGVPSRCVESTCDRLGQFGCDDLSEIKAVAESCRGN